MSSSLPDWLSQAASPSYLTRVLTSLDEREVIRDNARSTSRRTLPSPSTRRQLLPSFHSNQPLKGLVAHYSVTIGCQPENALRNRYYQLEPYNRTRVLVPGGQGSDGRYLNANWVLERFGHKLWVATQAPLPSTAHAFLSLLLQPLVLPPELSPSTSPALPSSQSRIRTVVQLTQNFESGRRKAHAYFPSEVGKSLVITPEEGCSMPALKVTLLGTCSFSEAHCIQSTVSIVPINLPTSSSSPSNQELEAAAGTLHENHGEEIDSQRVVFQHMLYASWPDHGVPSKEDQASILAFVRLVHSVNRDTSNVSQSGSVGLDSDPPIIVGCSAGIGRTGSFIAISSLLRHLRQLPGSTSQSQTSTLSPSPLGPLPQMHAQDLVAQEVDSLREQRPGMVQRNEQVLFIYEALVIALSGV
ncbi:hypothetical protein AMATHDRAFT_79848 [Amanita thiersii Skay4041]|uniref:Tyrosine specific protein phosphatases domain-containing protein n=1 Tax=Amanita thiersii Skay4041 TaxID=703135 RepID=A0A2A9NQH1_9AGAR|nr:hypothetical protein AMATHDRAFT_79848 [Amanita thiersii Skay4041]